MKMSNNPFKRVQQYLKAKKIHGGMSYILEQLKQFVSNKRNVYGLIIERTLVTDSLLVTSKTKTNNYPSQQEYYDLIKKLQDYIATNGASPANYPMLNIAEIDNNNFVTTVAIPVNKVLPDKGPILFKRMFPGKILTAEVKGGMYSIEKGFKQLNHYISDHQLSTPAIPFQSLITDRLLETDTSKWITKLYYPIY
jgi:effector-binding domain-containing protein